MRLACVLVVVAVAGCGPKDKTTARSKQITFEQPTQQAQPTFQLPPPATKANLPSLIDRSEFEKAVVNRRKEDIIAAVGRPDDTQELPFNPQRPSVLAAKWIYRNRVKNADTGKAYAVVAIWMNAESVGYHVEYP